MRKCNGFIRCAMATAWLVVLIQSGREVSALKNLPNDASASSQLLDAKTLLTRRKRYVFFTPGSAVQVTMSFSKAIIGSSPRGVNLLAEVDIYYPLQSKISDWFPMKRKKPVVLVAVAPAKPKIDHDAVENGIEYESAPPVLDRYYTSKRPTDYWSRPSTQTNQIAYIPNTANNNRDRYYYSSSSNRSDLLQPSSYDSYYRPRRPQTSPTANSVRRRQFQQQRPPPHPQPSTGFSASDTTSRRRNPALNANTNNNGPPDSLPGVQRPIYYSEWQKHHRGYRERRDIYTQFEAVAKGQGLDIRGCLLRLICETRHYLLPQGKSFFHDVMRILFYVPVPHAEPYAEAMRSTLESCTTEYRQQCRFSILGMLLHPDKQNVG